MTEEMTVEEKLVKAVRMGDLAAVEKLRWASYHGNVANGFVSVALGVSSQAMKTKIKKRGARGNIWFEEQLMQCVKLRALAIMKFSASNVNDDLNNSLGLCEYVTMSAMVDRVCAK